MSNGTQLSLAQQIAKIEHQAEQFQELADRVYALKREIKSHAEGKLSTEGLLYQLSSLVDSYERRSTEWNALVDEQGYQIGKLGKYCNSTYNSEVIITMKATVNGELYATTVSGEYYIGDFEEPSHFKEHFDFLICAVQYENGVEVLK